MTAKQFTPTLAVSDQVLPQDLTSLSAAGCKSVICNRPDSEGADPPTFAKIEVAATAVRMQAAYLPIVSGKVSDADARDLGALTDSLPKPILAYCRTDTRSATLWSLSEGGCGRPLPKIIAATKAAGYDMVGVVRRIANGGRMPSDAVDATHVAVIIGGGAAGIAVAASLKARKPDLDIAIIDPAEIHYYKPGWTMVGGGNFAPGSTVKTMGPLIPAGVRWIKAAMAAFEPAEPSGVASEGLNAAAALLESHAAGAGMDGQTTPRDCVLNQRPNR